MFCAGVIKSGKNKGNLCQCLAKSNGYCGRHQNQYVSNEYNFINNSPYNIDVQYIEQIYGINDEIETAEYIYIKTFSPYTVSNIELYDTEIYDYRIIYREFGSILYGFSFNILNISDKQTVLLENPDMYPNCHPILNRTYKDLYECWRKVALKALHLPIDIKKISDSDTVKHMCEMTEYIDLPEEITDRDYQLAGATYNPDDELVDPNIDYE